MLNDISSSPRLIAIYARVSTARQEEDQTIKTQLAAVKDLALERKYVIVTEYIDDGWSGDILARPALDRLREDARRKLWDAVLIYDPDRLARRYSYQELVMDELRDLGIGVLFVTTPSPATGEEKILHGVKGLFAEYERAKIAERSRLGKLRKAKEGHLVVSEAPYGYTYIPKRDGKHGYYEINESEARVVRLIYSLIADEGLTIRKVVKRLQEEGISPRKSKRGVWSTSTLGHILRNKTYIGEARYASSYNVVPQRPINKDKYRRMRKTSRRMRPENEWIIIPAPPILDKQQFCRASERLTKNSFLSQRNKKNPYLLSGLIYCSCGSRRVGEGPQHGKHLYYRCTARIMSYPLPAQCAEAGVNARISDQLVWNELKALLISPDRLRRSIDQQISGRQKAPGLRLEAVKKQVAALKKEEDRYVRAYGAELITMEQFKEYVGDIHDRQNSLRHELTRLEEEGRQTSEEYLPHDESAILAFAQCAKDALQEDLSFDEKRVIVMNVVDKVVAKRETIRITGVIPIQPLTNVACRPSPNTISNNHVKICPIDWHGWDKTSNKQIPFNITIPLPLPRYERVIVNRDKWGRILHSEPPAAA